MNLKEALEYVNEIKTGTQEQYMEAYTVMFKEMYGVNVKNQDGTYKNIYEIFLEASENFHTKLKKHNMNATY